MKGRVALVTGASGAIGGAIARALARSGARVVVTGRDTARLGALGIGLDVRSSEIEAHPCDLADEGAIRDLAARVTRSHGGVDVLVHAAGEYRSATVADTPVKELDALLRVNFRVPYELTRSLLPSLRDRRGQVVFLISSAATAPRGGMTAYASAKAALRAFATGLRHEVNRDGVRVLAVYPGRTASAMQEAMHHEEGKDYDPERLIQPDDIASSVLGALRLSRTAEVTDLHIRPFRPPV